MIRRKIPRNVMVWSGLLCILGWIMNLGYLSGVEQAIRRDARNDALLSARLFINQSDTIIQSIQSRFAILETVISNGMTLRQAVERGIVSMEHLVLLTLVDARGRTVETNNGADARSLDLSDREHVAVQLEGNERGLFIGKPVIGRISKSWSIQVTSAVRNDEGRMTGVLIASLDPIYFAKFWSDAFLRSDSFVEMFGDDGILRTTSRNLIQQLEEAKPDPELVAAAAAAEEGEVNVSRMGERYLSYFRRSKYFNTIAVVRVSEAQLDARIATVRLRHLAGGGFVTLIFLIGSGGLLASMRREEQTRQRAELAESRLRAAIGSMPVGFAMFDRHGRLVTQNASFEYAYADRQRTAAQRFAELRAMTGQAGTASALGPIELQPGPGSWARLYEVPIPDGGQICFSVPITDLKRRERDLIASQYMLEANQAQLTSLMQEAQAADRMKSRFLAMMSHELRTPLTAVVGFSELLRDEPLNVEARLFADQIDECARSLLAIIDDVFDITKLGTQPTKLNGTSIDVGRMLHSLTDVARLLVRSEAVAVGLDIDPAVPLTIFSDELKIRQCLLNFITNAARYTLTGRIDIKATYQSGRLDISVRDTGAGIPEARLAKLFQPLEEIATKVDLSMPGLGLGLSISKRLADIMGATLSAESQAGAGSTLTLSIPVGNGETLQAHVSEDGPQAGLSGGEGLRILVADDAASTRLLLTTMLKKLGHQVTAVEDGVRALEDLRIHRYDVVALDVQMPHLNGFDCAREIRMLPAGRQPRLLIALTAQTFDDDRERAIEAGFDHFISKPFTAQDFVQVLKDDVAAAKASATAQTLN